MLGLPLISYVGSEVSRHFCCLADRLRPGGFAVSGSVLVLHFRSWLGVAHSHSSSFMKFLYIFCFILLLMFSSLLFPGGGVGMAAPAEVCALQHGHCLI